MLDSSSCCGRCCVCDARTRRLACLCSRMRSTSATRRVRLFTRHCYALRKPPFLRQSVGAVWVCVCVCDSRVCQSAYGSHPTLGNRRRGETRDRTTANRPTRWNPCDTNRHTKERSSSSLQKRRKAISISFYFSHYYYPTTIVLSPSILKYMDRSGLLLHPFM